MEADFQVGIIGAGFGGLVAALRLQKEGRESFVIFERAAEVGGTWRDKRKRLNSFSAQICASHCVD